MRIKYVNMGCEMKNFNSKNISVPKFCQNLGNLIFYVIDLCMYLRRNLFGHDLNNNGFKMGTMWSLRFERGDQFGISPTDELFLFYLN